jgi:hypothetical protein
VDHRDLLLTLAQIGITLAALSGLAGIVGARRVESPREQLSIRLLRDVATVGMMATLFALLPLALDDGSATVWRWSSAAAAVSWIALLAEFARSGGALIRASEPVWKVAWPWLAGPLITLFGTALLTYNAIAPSVSSPQRYALAVLCMLVIAALNFLAGAFAVTSRPPAA